MRRNEIYLKSAIGAIVPSLFRLSDLEFVDYCTINVVMYNFDIKVGNSYTFTLSKDDLFYLVTGFDSFNTQSNQKRGYWFESRYSEDTLLFTVLHDMLLYVMSEEYIETTEIIASIQTQVGLLEVSALT